MYQNIPFSKNTRLVNSIISSDNTLTVEDVSVFPSAPNYATIGTDENAETIFYNAISSNELQNVERGKEGTAKSWSAGEIISRNFSNVDVVAFSNNITMIANFLNSHGNLFEYRKKSTNYTVGKLVQIPNTQNYIYLECVEGGTSSGSDITVTGVGQLITDGTCKWLSLDIRDSAPVGTIKQDIVIRDGYLLLNGQIVNVSDYPRLVNFLIANSLLNDRLRQSFLIAVLSFLLSIICAISMVPHFLNDVGYTFAIIVTVSFVVFTAVFFLTIFVNKFADVWRRIFMAALLLFFG